MKALLNSLLFVIAAGYAAAEIAGAAGATLPATVNAPNAAIAMLVTGLLAVWVADYSRRPSTALTLAVSRALPVPADVRKPRRSAYSIRRGVDAARLAVPAAVSAYRRTPALRYERVA